MKGKLGNKIRTVICVGCGKSTTEHQRPSQRYCSLECYRKSPKPARKTGATFACAICASPVYKPVSLHRYALHFCSAAHANQWQGRNKTSHTCKICGGTFLWSPSRHKTYNITYCSLVCRNADPATRERLIAMNAIQQTKKPTRLEVAGYAMLDHIGVPYSRQHVIDGKFTVDAFLPDAMLVIQFDGDYWHGNPARYDEPDKRQRARMNYDRSQDAYMRKHGYRIIRVWESVMSADPDSVERLIRQTTPPTAL